ncbi:MAG TPA: type 4a pilus biogenesis protein PilO [Acidimicrobiales bacterium]|nr:type 4a pilus biogenesis protein PilO [Acidimicrobiales bacterium]
MEKLTRYRIPLFTALGALVVAIIVVAAWISPEGSKLSSLKAQQTQLQSQESHLRTELATLKHDKAHLATNCAELTKDLTQVPGTPTVDDFFHQVTALAVAAGDPTTPSISVTQAPGAASAVKIVAVNLSLTGTYGQMSSFLKGLDGFPRLFTVTSITVTGGPVAVGGSAVNPSTAGYTLSLVGNIYYSTGQTNVCADASTTSAP